MQEQIAFPMKQQPSPNHRQASVNPTTPPRFALLSLPNEQRLFNLKHDMGAATLDDQLIAYKRGWLTDHGKLTFTQLPETKQSAVIGGAVSISPSSVPVLSVKQALDTTKRSAFNQLVRQRPTMTERELAQTIGVSNATAHRWRVAIK
jgi:hypothetical protein